MNGHYGILMVGTLLLSGHENLYISPDATDLMDYSIKSSVLMVFYYVNAIFMCCDITICVTEGH